MDRVNAVFRDQRSRDVVDAIMAIHFPQARLVADLTWGKGAFWRDEHASCVVGFDLRPRLGAQVKADARYAPLRDRAVDVVVFDPPHQHGLSQTTTLQHQEDFGRMASQRDIHQLIREVAPELRRVSRAGAVIKLTDMVEAGRFMPTHALVMSACAEVLGWPEDVAILDSGVVRPTRHDRVLHLRQAHSYFLVYRWDSRSPRSPLVEGLTQTP